MQQRCRLEHFESRLANHTLQSPRTTGGACGVIRQSQPAQQCERQHAPRRDDRIGEIVQRQQEPPTATQDAMYSAQGDKYLIAGLEMIQGRAGHHDLERLVSEWQLPDISRDCQQLRMTGTRGGQDGRRDVHGRDVPGMPCQHWKQPCAHRLIEEIRLEQHPAGLGR